MEKLELKSENIDGWKLNALEFSEDNNILKKVILGKLSNSQTDAGQNIRFEWQTQIANEIKSIRGIIPRSSKNQFAISLGMKFSRHDNQKQPLDVDNFIKPIFAGIAAGLFSTGNLPIKVEDFKDDDSRFIYLYVEKLDVHASTEGVAIVISELKII